MEPNIPATSPDASIPPAQSLLDQFSAQQAQIADLAEHMRQAWLVMQQDKVSLRYRDSVFDLAQRLHQAALLCDAICSRAVAENRYVMLASTPHTSLDWHEAPIFADPTVADAPALPDGGSAL